MKTKQKPLNVQRTLALAEKHLRRDEFDQAQEYYSAILEKFPKNNRAQEGLGALRQKQAKLERPELTQAMVDRMFAQRAEGKLIEALTEARLLSTAYPEEPVLHNFLATCYFETEQLDHAREACKRALKAYPDYPEAHLNISIAYRLSGQYELALTHIRRAIALRPAYVAAHTNLGLLLDLMNQTDEAIESLKKALEINPNAADVYNNLGGIYRFAGEPEKAAECFARSIELNPNVAEVHCNLSDLVTYSAGDPRIGQMETLLAKPGQSPKDRFPLGFALAKAYEDTGDTERSFETLVKANGLRKETYPFDIEDTRQQIEAIKACFEDGPLPVVDTPAPASRKKPIFIVGLPRSGTTLVEQIIASHSTVHGAGELHRIGELMNRIVPLDPLSPPVDEIDDATLLRARDAYLQRLHDLGVEEDIITDKMPLNFKWVGFLVAMFEGVRIVHVKRDPMATCFSMFKRRFAGAGNGFAYDLDDLADYHAIYSDIMAFWQEHFGENILTLNYEALTEYQESETRQLLEFLGLDWEDQCLEFHQTDRSVRTASGEQVRRKMYTGSSDVWKAYERQLEPLRERLAISG